MIWTASNFISAEYKCNFYPHRYYFIIDSSSLFHKTLDTMDVDPHESLFNNRVIGAEKGSGLDTWVNDYNHDFLYGRVVELIIVQGLLLWLNVLYCSR